MKIFFSAFLIVCTLSSCVKKTTKVCKPLKKFVKDNWRKDKTQNYYHISEGFTKTLEKKFTNCLLNMSKDNVINTFGEPVFLDTNPIFYYLDEGCFTPLMKNCRILIFGINEQTNMIYSIREEMDEGQI